MRLFTITYKVREGRATFVRTVLVVANDPVQAARDLLVARHVHELISMAEVTPREDQLFVVDLA